MEQERLQLHLSSNKSILVPLCMDLLRYFLSGWERSKMSLSLEETASAVCSLPRTFRVLLLLQRIKRAIQTRDKDELINAWTEGLGHACVSLFTVTYYHEALLYDPPLEALSHVAATIAVFSILTAYWGFSNDKAQRQRHPRP